MTNEDRVESLEALRFLEQYVRDQKEGVVRSLDDYLALFPTSPDVIRREYASLREGDDPRQVDVEPADRDSLEGLTFGHYQVIEEIGRGGHGVVYRAVDTLLSRSVALKVLAGPFFRTESMRHRLTREAEAASSLDHPGICAVHELGEKAGVPYIAMRYVTGEPLSHKIAAARERRKAPDLVDLDSTAGGDSLALDSLASVPRRITRVIEFIEKTARALHVAHEGSLIHRDIKPANIMVTREGEPVILDFGLARAETGDHPTLTDPGQIVGTPAYMAPEQLRGENRSLDRRCDIYSLGVTLYECITLQRPFSDAGREQPKRCGSGEPPKNPRRLNPAIPRDLAAVVEKAIERDSGRRYATAKHLGDDLRAVIEGRPVTAKAVTPLGRAIRWAQRKPVDAALVGVVLLGLSVAGMAVRHLADLRASSEESRQREEGGRLLAEAIKRKSVNPEFAMLTAIEAAKRHQGAAANSLLLELLGSTPRFTALVGHTQIVSAIAFSHDETLLATGSKDGTVRLWDLETGRPHARVVLTKATADDYPVRIAFNPLDPDCLLIGCRKSLSICEPSTGKTRHFWKGARIANSRAFDPTGSRLVYEVGRRTATRVVVRDVSTGRKLLDISKQGANRTQRPGSLKIARFLGDGQRIVYATSHAVTIIGSANGQVRACVPAHDNSSVECIEADSSGRLVAIASRRHLNRPYQRTEFHVCVADAVTGFEVLAEPLMDLKGIHLSDDGKVLCVGHSKQVDVWDLAAGRKSNSLQLEQPAMPVQLSPDKTTLLADSQSTFQTYDLRSEKQTAIMSGYRARLSPSGTRIAASRPSNIAAIWRTAEAVRRMPTIAVPEAFGQLVPSRLHVTRSGVLINEPPLSPDRAWCPGSREDVIIMKGTVVKHFPSAEISTVFSAGVLDILDLKNGSKRGRIKLQSGAPDAISIDDTGRTLLTLVKGQLSAWDVESGRKNGTCLIEGTESARVGLNQVGEFALMRVTSERNKNELVVWNMKNRTWRIDLGEHQPMLPITVPCGAGVRFVAARPRGCGIFSWRPEFGNTYRVVAGLDSRPATISPDGTKFVVVRRATERSAEVEVYCVAAGRKIGRITNSHPLRTVQFSRDSNRLLGATRGQLIYIYALDGRLVTDFPKPHRYPARPSVERWNIPRDLGKRRVRELVLSPDGGAILRLGRSTTIGSADDGHVWFSVRFEVAPVAGWFSRDSKEISVIAGRTVHTFPVDPLQAALACKVRDLTATERQWLGLPEGESR